MSIPVSGRVHKNVEASLDTVSRDAASPFLDDTRAFMPDWRYDMFWIDMAATSSGDLMQDALALDYLVMPDQHLTDSDDPHVQDVFSTLVPAMYYADAPETEHITYSRYWMLVVGLLRVLFLFFSLKGIRFLFWSATLMLYVYVCYLLGKKAGLPAVFALTCAFLSRNLFLHAFSITTACDIFVTLAAIAILLRCYENEKFQNNLLYYYLVVGIFCFSFGSIIAPLLTLGMPLLTEALISEKKEGRLLSLLIDAIKKSFCWLFGFAASMVIKTFLATVITHDDGGASGKLMGYLMPEEGLLSRLAYVADSFDRLFAPDGAKKPVLLLILILFIVYAWKQGARKNPIALVTCMIALYPIVWTILLPGHSTHYFAANNYAVVVYGFLVSILLFCKKSSGDTCAIL